MVARHDLGHGIADGLDDPGAFMPQHHRQGRGEVLVTHHHVGMADAGGDHTHEHLVGTRPLDLAVLQHERRSGLSGDGGGDGVGFDAGGCCLVSHGGLLG